MWARLGQERKDIPRANDIYNVIINFDLRFRFNRIIRWVNFKISQNICLPITIQASVAFIDCVVLTFPVESLRRGTNRIQVWKPDKQFVYTEYFLKYRLLPNEVLNQLFLRTQIIKIKARSRLHCRNIFFKH